MTESLILVYGDSMCMPSVGDGVEIADSYAELLAQRQTELGFRCRVYNRAEGGRTIRDHLTRYRDDRRYFQTRADDLLIIHAGMVDCAPRPLPQKWRRRLERQPGFIREPIVSFLKKNRPWMLKRGYAFRKVDPPTFRARLDEWLVEATKACPNVVVIGMPPIAQAAEDHSPGWQESVVLYNQITREVVDRNAQARFADVHTPLVEDRAKFEACISSVDGYHLTAARHRLIRDLIIAFLEASP